jgi:hypothetical protein
VKVVGRREPIKRKRRRVVLPASQLYFFLNDISLEEIDCLEEEETAGVR